MVKSQNCEANEGLKKGSWTAEEDQKLLGYIQQHGHGSWRALPNKAGLQRCGKSCRLRWKNYLKPDIKRGKFSLEEERTIIQLHALLGNRWSVIATQLPNRTDNEIKNYWNTRVKKKLFMMGFDPETHKRQRTTLDAANLSHIAQWESTRLEAERRLVRESENIRNRVLNCKRHEYSFEQIAKKMPTIFAPPRWQSQLLWNLPHPEPAGSCLGEFVHSKNETSSESGIVLAEEWLKGCEDFPKEDYNKNLIESGCQEINEVNKSYWNQLLYSLNYGPSNFSTF